MRNCSRPRCNISGLLSLDASGHTGLTFPSHQWTSAPTGSKGQKTILIGITALLFAQPGTSSDIPGFSRLFTSLAAQRFSKFFALQHADSVAPSFLAAQPVGLTSRRAAPRVRGLRSPACLLTTQQRVKYADLQRGSVNVHLGVRGSFESI